MTREEAVARAGQCLEPDVFLDNGRGLGYRLESAALVTDRDLSPRVRAPYWAVCYGRVQIRDGQERPTGRHPMLVYVDATTGEMEALDVM